MLLLIFYYLILPFILAALLLRFLGKWAPRHSEPILGDLLREHPMEPKTFRAVRIVEERKGDPQVFWIGDFETHVDARDTLYRARQNFAPTPKARFLILDDQGITLEEI